MPRRGEKKARGPIGDPSESDGLGVWVARYLEWLRVRNYSERTIGNREMYLRFFVAWAEARGVMRPREVTKPILERYQRYLFHLRKDNGRPLSFPSQISRLVPVRAYFKWLTRQNVLLSNPASELELPRPEHRLPRAVLSPEEADQVMNVPDIRTSMGMRDRAILETFYSTGIRRQELLNLKVYDLDAERGTLTVRKGKNNKDRIVPIGERAIAWVDKYMREVRPELVVGSDEGTLFLTNSGESVLPNRVSQMVREAIDAAQLGKRGSCHVFRHTMATVMLENGADIRYIQEMLGHAELGTTQIYTRVSIRKLQEIHAATHPSARMGKRTDARQIRETSEAGSRDELFSQLAAEAAEDDAEG